MIGATLLGQSVPIADFLWGVSMPNADGTLADLRRLYHHVTHDGQWDYKTDTRRLGKAIEAIETLSAENSRLSKEVNRLQALGWKYARERDSASTEQKP